MDRLTEMKADDILNQYLLDTSSALIADDAIHYLNIIGICGYIHTICRADPKNIHNTRSLFDLIKCDDPVRTCDCGAVIREVCPYCNMRNIIIQTEVIQANIAVREPHKQFNKCLSAIQAICIKDVPQTCIDRVRQTCITEKRGPGMRIDDMREILRLLRLAKYYPESVYIIQMVYEIKIYKLSADEKALITARFVTIKQILSNIADRGSNVESYGYYIYKIIEGAFPKDSGPYSLLKYIHLKHDDTLKKDDRIYKQVCETLGDPFIYKQTIRI